MSKNYDKINNKLLYSTTLFDEWAYRDKLTIQEKYLIETYLKKDVKTLEVGTGGGRILFGMRDLGFSSLYGVDFIYEFIDVAKSKDVSNRILFAVQDATELGFKDSSFDQIIYLQQIISFVEAGQSRLKAMNEAYRILKNKGIALFSFLCFDVRIKGFNYFLYLNYIKILRKILGSNRGEQYIPWLKLGGKFNISSLLDRGPYVY